MLYGSLKAIHLLSYVVWVGGMFFTLAVLRPSLMVLEGPSRLKLMTEVLRRFLQIVGIAVGLMVVSGGAMLSLAMFAAHDAGARLQLPWTWMVMITLGIVMGFVYGHLRGKLLGALRAALAAQDTASAATALGKIRSWVGLNLAIGIVVALVMRIGVAV